MSVFGLLNDIKCLFFFFPREISMDSAVRGSEKFTPSWNLK